VVGHDVRGDPPARRGSGADGDRGGAHGNRVLDAVAAELGNTRAVCRKGYVHPDVIAGYLRGVVAPHGRLARVAGLHADEQDVLALLTTLRRQTPGARSRHATRAPQDGPARHVA
jgi:DNA topoisomerase IB